jgi:hypothetical protein
MSRNGWRITATQPERAANSLRRLGSECARQRVRGEFGTVAATYAVQVLHYNYYIASHVGHSGKGPKGRDAY